MSTARSAFRIGSALAVVLVLTAAAVGTLRTRDDGVDSTILGVFGGGSEAVVGASDLPSHTDIVVRGTVVDVDPAVLNTPTGGFPEYPGSPAAGVQLIPTMNVTIALSAGPWGRESVAATGQDADLISVTVFGGVVHETMEPQRALRWGVYDLVGEEGPDSYAVEVPPTSAQEVTMGYAPSAHLTEGDTVTLFLRRHSLPVLSADGRSHATSADVWVLAAGSQAVFTQRGDGWAQNAGPSAAVDDASLLELIREVEHATGDAKAP